MSDKLRASLARLPTPALTFLAMGAAFGTYFCMYAFRKPFAVGTFEGEGLAVGDRELTLKTVFVLSQIIGYAISKYLGIKICSETTRKNRALVLAGLVLIAELALLLFAVLPGKSAAIAIFVNGLPLGMVWGLVVLYLEGRRTSELLLTGLSCSFIISSGVVKDLGRWLMREHDVAEMWMPFVTGLIFLAPFLLLVWFLDHMPEPTREDQIERSKRTPMHFNERIRFTLAILPALIPLLIAYLLLTAFRDYRDNYGIDIYNELGETGAAVFTETEIMVAFGVLVVLALVNLVRSNRWGLFVVHLVMGLGVAMLGIATLLLEAGTINGYWWMVLLGLGAYLAYVPFGSVFFDRMVAATRLSGNAVFVIYLFDAIGYTGSVGVLIYNDLFEAASTTRLEFFKGLTNLMAFVGVFAFAFSAIYFWRRSKPIGANGDNAIESA